EVSPIATGRQVREGGEAVETRARKPALGVTYRMRDASGAVVFAVVTEVIAGGPGAQHPSHQHTCVCRSEGLSMSSRYLWRIFSATSAISLCTASLPALAQELRLDTIVVSPNRAP